MFTLHLFDDQELIGTLETEEAPENCIPEPDGTYSVYSDDPTMPTDAMLIFIQEKKLRIPYPMPSSNKNHADELLNEFKDYVLAKEALDDYKDIIFLIRNGQAEQVFEYILDSLQSRIYRNLEFKLELDDLLNESDLDTEEDLED